jgi:Zn-dependent metalloprotease
MIKKTRWIPLLAGVILSYQSAFSAAPDTSFASQVHLQRGVKLHSTDSHAQATEIERTINSELHGMNSELRIQDVTEDAIKTKHFRLQQFYKNIPVEGAIIWRRTVPGDTLLDTKKGSSIDNLDVDVIPRIEKSAAAEICLKDAINTTPCKPPGIGRRNLNDAEMLIQTAKKNSGVTIDGEPELVIVVNRLAYKVIVAENGINFANWVYFVDAQSGEIISVADRLRYANPPSQTGYTVPVDGIKLLRESPSGQDETVSITGWKDAVGAQNYFLAYPGNGWIGQWLVYDYLSDDYEQQSTAHWGTNDRFSISVAKNAEIIQNWVTNTLGVYGADNTGKPVLFTTHVPGVPSGLAENLRIYLSDPYVDPTPGSVKSWSEAGCLDVIAHEFGHLISYAYDGPGSHWTGYESITGHTFNQAINESNSDIMATAVEFASQTDGSSEYPGSIAGEADWLLGEDFDNNCIDRDMRFPQRPTDRKAEVREGRATRYFGSGFAYNVNDDNYGYILFDSHQIAGIQNFAFYLLSQGSATAQTNDGLNYGVFPGVGIQLATRIAMTANMYILNNVCNFQDVRKVWKQIAQDLVSQGVAPSFAPQTVEAAWSAVGVEPELRISYNGAPYAQVANHGELITAGAIHQSAFGTGSFRFTNSNGASVGLQGPPLATAGSILLINGINSAHGTQGSNLDNTTWTRGKLIIRLPNGQVNTAIDNTGNVYVRGQAILSGTLIQ